MAVLRFILCVLILIMHWLKLLTKTGLIGVKVWICKGMVYGIRDLSPNVGAKTRQRGQRETWWQEVITVEEEENSGITLRKLKGCYSQKGKI
jgi:hypothetical protein